MANHLTPEELAKEINWDRNDVIRFSIVEGVPIYQGKIDKHLFRDQLGAIKREAFELDANHHQMTPELASAAA